MFDKIKLSNPFSIMSRQHILCISLKGWNNTEVSEKNLTTFYNRMEVQQLQFFKSQYINAAITFYLFIASLSNFKVILVFFRDKTYCIKINTAYVTSKDVTNDSMCYTQKLRKFAPVYSHICSHVAWCIVKRKKYI